MEGCQGLCSITKRDFFRLFWTAWDSSLKPTTILSAFEATGLAPFDPERVLACFRSRDNRPSSSDSTSSVLSASDWRKIERLLCQVVEDIYDSWASKLSHTIHSIAAEKQILQVENEQLKEALINERKRRQRGKLLLLEPAAEYNGGAVFWSPTKVAQARQHQADKDEEKKAIQAQKDAESKRREEAKAQKAALLEERRQLRAAAKLERQWEREQKAFEVQETQQARTIEKQLRDDIRLAKRGKKKSLKPPAATPEAIKEVQPEIPVLEVDRAATTRTCKIRLPSRFRQEI
ncbi:uncharacterized protein EI97DRAFT_96011 [Westerdykella ornata]|uniref:Uncharacterized protein n=1 Tax=Westerdykella ornata TaxID=318751 RepID=A0A6A6JDM5_WESOR|nr:uncharacterized protein EI97DRAFT_96011 [Westerdykella ornata]KAF2274661.1 hypothetical protein EI97DRAFT_96011 [Westerdykella ornata]